MPNDAALAASRTASAARSASGQVSPLVSPERALSQSVRCRYLPLRDAANELALDGLAVLVGAGRADARHRRCLLRCQFAPPGMVEGARATRPAGARS